MSESAPASFGPVVSDGSRTSDGADHRPTRVTMMIADAHAPDARVQKELESLVGAGYEVDVVCWDREQDERLPGRQVELHGVVSRYKRPCARGRPLRFIVATLLFYLYVLRQLAGRRPDVVHVHSVQVLPLGVFLKLRWAVPLVYDVHEITETFGGGLSRHFGAAVWKVERHLVRYVDVVLTVSDGLRERYGREVRPETPVTVLMNCAPVPEVVDRRTDAHSFVIGRIGNLRPRSRVDMLAEIIVRLNELGHHVRFRYAGCPLGDYRATVEAAHERMAAYAEYSPWVPYEEFGAFYAGIDLVLNIHERGDALEEHLAYFSKVFEAMAFGVPAVINDFPSMTPIIERTGAGVVVREFSVDAFVQTLADLIRNRAHLDQMRERCRRVARDEFNWGVMERRLLACYSKIA